MRPWPNTKDALRIKPDYAVAHYDLGLLLHHMHNYDGAIVEYRKCIALDPTFADAHNNLGTTYNTKGDTVSAIREFREAKRLNPNDPAIRENLGAALMQREPGAAVVELRELEKLFPDFEM